MKIELGTEAPVKGTQRVDVLCLERGIGHEFVWADEVVLDQSLDLAEAELPHLLTGELIEKNERKRAREIEKEDRKKRWRRRD